MYVYLYIYRLKSNNIDDTFKYVTRMVNVYYMCRLYDEPRIVMVFNVSHVSL